MVNAGRHNVADFYGKQEALFLNGIAILMMFWHHFFGYNPGRNEAIEFFTIPIGSVSLEGVVAVFCKLCVAVFAFNTGYIIWKRANDYLCYRKIFLRLLRFLLSYWVVCLLFLVVGYFIGHKLPSLTTFGWNLIGLSLSQDSGICVIFGWYVFYYIVLILLSPGLLLFYKRTRIAVDLFSLGVICLLFSRSIIALPFGSMQFLEPIIVSVVGIMTAKYQIFSRIDKVLGFNKLPKIFFALIVLFFLRLGLVKSGVFYSIYVVDALLIVPFIYCMVSFFRLSCMLIKNVGMTLGLHSMYFWFLHSFFFIDNLSVQKFLYFPYIPTIILIWGMAIMLPIAMFLGYFQNKLDNGNNTFRLIYSKFNP
ncbi:acyltransferase family protein [Alistipes sp.]|uniref:acyltransferase family protein n=1 Tax=Alistipes sp. TaxID=1872444 RepID=UPI003AF104B2